MSLAGQWMNRLADASIFFSFDRSGFRRHQRRFQAADLEVDLAGKRCLVTGANSGLGRAAAQALAFLGAEVWLLCRSEERGRVAERDIRMGTGNDRGRLEIIDLASRASILRFVERLGDRPVDVLINNAGVLPDQRIESEDGMELTWATNVVGPFLLTWKLVPHLQRAAGGRVINVSSGGMYTQQLDLRDVHWLERPFDGVVAYAQSKRAEVILTELWADRLRDRGISVNSMHPGWADTAGVRHSLPRFWRLTQGRLRSPREGADTIVWLAACERIAGETGQFWFDRQAVATHLLRTRERSGDRQRLWELCRQQAGLSAGSRLSAGSLG
ncbi:MAG: SDR family NAD(P)-dependent oxidoreductase [Acidobacteriota bacterium]